LRTALLLCHVPSPANSSELLNADFREWIFSEQLGE
jgi:hypothetical protein